MRNVSDKVEEKIKTHILCSVPIFSENRAVYEIIKKYGTDGQTTVENMAHVHCMLDN